MPHRAYFGMSVDYVFLLFHPPNVLTIYDATNL